MLRGIFGQRSPFLQFLLLVFLSLGGFLFFTSAGIILASFLFPYEVADILSSAHLGGGWTDTAVLKFLQAFITLGTFLVPGLFGAWLLSERPSEFLAINRFPANPVVISIWVLVMTLSGTTISDALYRFSYQLSWPDILFGVEQWVKRNEGLMSDQMQRFLAMDSPMDFVEVFFLLAILPAVAEETLFRGAIQPVLKRAFGGVHLAVWVTAFLFGLLHQQFYSFLSIFALGAVLGYLREWSRSLWVPMLMHLINNGSIVIAIYFFDMPYQEVSDISQGWQWYYLLPGALVFVLSLYVLKRRFGRHHAAEPN